MQKTRISSSGISAIIRRKDLVLLLECGALTYSLKRWGYSPFFRSAKLSIWLFSIKKPCAKRRVSALGYFPSKSSSVFHRSFSFCSLVSASLWTEEPAETLSCTLDCPEPPEELEPSAAGFAESESASSPEIGAVPSSKRQSGGNSTHHQFSPWPLPMVMLSAS